jgi:acetyl-CoA synthetase
MTEPAASFRHNLQDYESVCRNFSWEKEAAFLYGMQGGRGLNIAFEAVDRHVLDGNGHITALRMIRKDRSFEDFSYERLKDLSARFAHVISGLGIKKEDVVFSLLGRVPELYISVLGSLKTGAVFCPLFSVFGPEPIFQRLSKGNGRILVTNTAQFEKKVVPNLERLPHLDRILLTDSASHHSDRILSLPLLMKETSPLFDIADTQPEDPALLHFTSGTTGMPKGALHVHKAALTHYITGKYVLDFHLGDVFWCTADPGWVTGTSYGIISPLLHGVTNLCDEEEFDAMRWYSILEEHKVNIWYTAPTAIRRLMRLDIDPKRKFDLSRLRQILSVGEPLHAGAVIWGEKTFGFPVLDNWWQTETGGIMIANFPSLPVKPGSMGKPVPGIEAAIGELHETGIRILNEADAQGQLVLKTGFPSQFRAYIHEEERYSKCFLDGWYISGDLARRDADGYFWFVGRADDIIKTSGHMVGPFEVESCLMAHPAVAEAAVIGKPDALIGELVKAFVVLKAGESENDALRMDILAFARKKLGPAVAPKEIQFSASLPKTRSGKILRRLLKARELGLPEGDLSTLENP